MLATHKRHPSRPVRIYNREVEHIHNFTVEPGRISSSFGHKARNLRMCAFIEDHSIKDTIYNITQSTGQNQSHTNNIACFESFFYYLVEIPPYQRYRNNTESGQEQLPKNLHTESHSIVFGEIDIKPIRHTYAFMPIHMSFNPDFNDLVNNQYGKDNEQSDSPFRE